MDRRGGQRGRRDKGPNHDMKMGDQCQKWLEQAAMVVDDARKSRKLLTAMAHSLAKKPVNRDQFQYAKVDGKHESLTFAVRNGHLFLFEQLLRVLHVDPNLPDPLYGTIPLHHAAACGQIKMMESLIETYQSNIEAGDFGRSTPLFFAISHHQNASVCKLLAYGASSDVECFLGQPMHIALYGGNFGALQALHKKNPAVVNSVLNEFCTPLVAASLYECTDCFKYLTEVADVHAQGLMYKVICCCASEEKSLDRIGILINRGLSPNLSYDAVTLLEDLPIICAAKRGWKKVIESLLNLTEEIPGVQWTVEGVLQYVNSELFEETNAAHRATRVAYLKKKLVEELNQQHYLAADLICKVLHVDMEKEEWDLFQSLCSFLIMFGSKSIFPECNSASIHFVVIASDPYGEDLETHLLAAKACLALEPESQIYRDFLLEVKNRMGGSSSGNGRK